MTPRSARRMALPFTATLDVLYSLLPVNLQKPRVGIVCGSGLSGLAEILRNVVYIPYDSLPGFSESTGIDSSLMLHTSQNSSQWQDTKVHLPLA